MKKKRGVSVVEYVITLFVSVLVAGAMVAFCRTGDRVWSASDAQETTKDLLYQAIAEMTPVVRNAYQIDPSSTADTLVVDMPKVDAVNGGYVTPLKKGDVYAFYLSDLTGNMGTSGSILWVSINGIPQSGWSLKNNSRGAVDLGDSLLSFTYPVGTPASVGIAVTATRTAPRAETSVQSSEATLVLRNASSSGG